jgi:hypothetical protein
VALPNIDELSGGLQHMRSRSTPPVTSTPEKQRRAARATPQMAAGAPTTGRRTRRTQTVTQGAPDAGAELPGVSSAALATLPPQELYRREKARRVGKLDNDVMAEAKRMLDEMLAESSKRGGTVKGGRPARRPVAKSSDPVDAMNLEDFDGLDAPEKDAARDE